MKNFDCGLFPNTFKKGQNDPDATGTLRIPASVINEAYIGISNGSIQLKPGYGDNAEPCIELRAAAWKGDGSLSPSGKPRPAISVRFDSPTEAAARDAARAQNQAQGQGQQWGAPAPAQAQQAAPGQWGGQAPQAAAPAPAAAPAAFDMSIPF
jgi:hypothetical protein